MNKLPGLSARALLRIAGAKPDLRSPVTSLSQIIHAVRRHSQFELKQSLPSCARFKGACAMYLGLRSVIAAQQDSEHSNQDIIFESPKSFFEHIVNWL